MGTPLEWRGSEASYFLQRPMSEFANELKESMMKDPDGTSRFGALATVRKTTKTDDTV